MAQIIENKRGRRLIRLNTNDIITLIQEYQNTVRGKQNYREIRAELDKREIYLPEDI